jgi:hypothetical protein
MATLPHKSAANSTRNTLIDASISAAASGKLLTASGSERTCRRTFLCVSGNIVAARAPSAAAWAVASSRE